MKKKVFSLLLAMLMVLSAVTILPITAFAGDDPGTELTPSQAAAIAAALEENNTPTTTVYSVTGYVTNTNGVISKGQQTFWLDDEKGTKKTFEGYYCNLPANEGCLRVGDRVTIVGKIMRYSTTYEMKNGDVTILERAPAVINGTPEIAKETNHGYITVDNTFAAEGETVTVTVDPAEGYQLASLKYNDGSDHAITKDATSGEYQFTMPVKAVTVTAMFAPELTAPQVPTVAEEDVKALMCDTYENNLGWAPCGWGGCNWTDKSISGVNFPYAQTMAWDCFAGDFTGAGVADYDNLHFDIWFPEDGNAPVVKLEFTSSDPSTETTIPGTFKAGWNSVSINVKDIFGEQPMDELRCLTVKVDTEGVPVAWANILFYNGTYTSIDPAEIDHAITNGTTDDNGSITVAANAKMDETVTVTVAPADGYQLKTLKYNDGTTDYDVTKDATSGEYQFTMPPHAVTVTAEFEEAAHIHSFTYVANNGKITATCTQGCDEGYDTTPLTLTLIAPTSLAYDGNAKGFIFADGEVTAWMGAGLELPTIIYYVKQSGQSTYMPLLGILKSVGNYMAEITVDEKTAQVEFAIDKATPYIKDSPEPTDIVYGKKLSDSTLFGGYVQVSSTNTTQVGGLFEWKLGDTIPALSDSETTEYDVTFTPEDTNNYNTVSCKVKIKVTHTHTGVKQNGQPATETAAGYKDYYRCSCGKYFAEEACTTLIGDESALTAWKAEGGDGYLDKLSHSHNFEKQDAVNATADTAGCKEYYACPCGDAYEDKALTKKITDLNSWKAEGGNGYVAPNGAGDPEPDDEGKNLWWLWVLIAVVVVGGGFCVWFFFIRKKNDNGPKGPDKTPKAPEPKPVLTPEEKAARAEEKAKAEEAAWIAEATKKLEESPIEETEDENGTEVIGVLFQKRAWKIYWFKYDGTDFAKGEIASYVGDDGKQYKVMVAIPKIRKDMSAHPAELKTLQKNR